MIDETRNQLSPAGATPLKERRVKNKF